MTPAQKKSRENFKKAVSEAKKLRAKNPKLSQAQAVKQAWAILYSTGKVGKAKTKKAAKKKSATKNAVSTHKDTKSHNVNIKVVSGIGALPVGMTGKFWGVPFKVFNQYDIYGAVSAIIEDTSNGRLIVEVTDRTKLPGQIESFKNYIASAGKIESYQIDNKVLERDAKSFITDLYKEVKKFNEGKTTTTKPKKAISIKAPKRSTTKAPSGKTTKESLKTSLKTEGLKLTHGYNLAARKIGAVNDEYKNIITYENEIAKIKNFIKNHPGLTQKVKNEYAKGINYYKRLITSAKYNISLHKR